jgi:hypothetical protein
MSIYIVDDSNAHILADEQAAAYGEPSVLPRSFAPGELACCRAPGDAIPLIPESEWIDRIKERKALGQFPGQRRRALSAKRGKSVIKYQNGLGYCHLYGLASSVEYLRQMAGLDYVELAPESGGGVVGWQNRGGTMDRDIEWIAQRGFAPRNYVPEHSINPRTYKSGWDNAAKAFAPAEWYDLTLTGSIWQATVSTLLAPQPLPVYMGCRWWSHAFWACGLEVLDGEVCLEIENSHGVQSGKDGYLVLRGSKKIPSVEYGVFAPRAGYWGASE